MKSFVIEITCDSLRHTMLIIARSEADARQQAQKLHQQAAVEVLDHREARARWLAQRRHQQSVLEMIDRREAASRLRVQDAHAQCTISTSEEF